MRAYAMLWLTKHGQRARKEAVDRWGTSGGVAGVERQRGRAGVGYGDGGAPRARRLLLRGRKEARSEMGARLSAGGRWHDEGALGRGVACADRALATRGRRRGHAVRGFCRCRPLNVCDSVDSVARCSA